MGKKHGDAIQEMTEQITQLSAMKSKIEKDKGKIHLEANDARSATDEIGRAKSSSEKSNKILATSLNELGKKVEEANMTLGDFESQKRRLAAVDDTKHVADTEARERQLLVGKFKNLEHELDGMKEHLDEELASYDEISRQTTKAEGEAGLWRSKYETDAVAKAEELEMTKMKLTSRLTEAETTISNLTAKYNQIDRSKGKID